MSCEAYREKLNDALVRGDAALGEVLATHLRACADCGEFYEAQKRLLGAMDSGVKAMVSEETPPSLLPRVRARMEEAPFEHFRMRWTPATAAVVVLLVLITFPLLRSKFHMKETTPAIAPSARPDSEASAELLAPELREQATADEPPRTSRRSPAHPTRRAIAAPGMEVVIDRAEEQGLRQLAKTAASDPQWAQAMARPGKALAMSDETIQSERFADLKLPPLEEVR